MLWEQKDQNAYIHFPQVLTETELLPFIIRNDFKHSLYKNFTTFPVQYFQNIVLNPDFITQQSEISHNRPYVSNVNPLASDTNIIQHTINDQETVIQYQPSVVSQDSLQTINNAHESIQDDSINDPNESLLSDKNLTNHQTETSQIAQDTTDSLQNTIINQPTSSTAADSNELQVPIHNITNNPNNRFHSDNTSILSTTNTTAIQPPQTHQVIQRNYDPRPPPSNNSNHSTPHSSPQQGSSNTFRTQNQTLTQSQFQMATPPQQTTQPIQYIPAQLSKSQNTNPILTINILHTNPGTNLTTSRTLSRPPLQLIHNKSLSYNPNSTNFHQQPSSTITQNPSTHQSLSTQVDNHLSFPTTQTNPPIQTLTFNILPLSQNSHTTHTIPPITTPPLTHTTPTYINSSTSFSEPIKSFDGLDYNYTPEEYLQHIEARVTFSLGLQPTNAHEYKFWHARRIAFIQCSLTGTALSWYIRLNDTYKQDWHAFVQAFKKQFSSQKNAYYAQVEALSLVKKDNETVRHFALKVQQLVEKGWRNENASTINLKCNEIFTKGLPKNLKNFANKRQVKQTSTVLEPSIPFHTLVKLVDAEDIANDKIHTHDLTLEVNNITKQLQTQTLNSQQSD